jgi:chemosensory pili system protein ChpA (sensor histidine kinase/response regulator)
LSLQPEVEEALVEEPEASEHESVLQADEEVNETLRELQEPIVKPLQNREQTSMLRDDLDEQLLPIFIDEADDLLPKIGSNLRDLRQNPQGEINLLNRLLHTLKGSARMTGAMRMGEIAHAMESRVLEEALTDAVFDDLEDKLDQLNGLLEDLRSGKVQEPVAASAAQETVEVAAPIVGLERTQQVSMLRVRSDVVDRLVNQAGEVSVARSRMETELRAFKEGLLELSNSVARLRKQLREVEIQAESQIQARVTFAAEHNEQFDPLEFDRFTRLQELTRFMNESVHDVQTVQQTLLKNIDETNSALFVQGRLSRELQQNLMSVRMVPFSSMSERLYRLVRQTGKELNKRVNLELEGTNVELDRSVLEKMTAPFEHMLRNAIVHGLEEEKRRVENGKDAIGEIRLSLRQESNEVVFELSDDGAGLNYAGLRADAIKKGVLDEADDTVTDDQLAQLIFTTGVSTAEELTEVAGRGVGMDVVRSEITALGGRIEVSSQPGKGTRFTIHLPLTLAVTQVLMVRSGDDTYAIPSAMVEQVRQIKPDALQSLYADKKLEWNGQTYPFHYLPALLGDDERVPEIQPYNPLLLLRSGNQRIALHVDELRGNREAVVKNIGPQLSRLPGIAGATVQGNGAVVLILNPAQIKQTHTAVRKVQKVETVLPSAQPTIMVVDDSLTVRKITTRLLMRAGYQVVTAQDGVDALEQLKEIIPSVMLLDIEMPRMDGFELTKLMRRDDRTKGIPIIMITSRAADKHRDHAMSLGVSAYLGKPFQEEELLEQIAALLPVPA